ncbi:hypothetical protein [Nocardia salmonicida]|uniref:hypothetical protein n=1 Tax=Nocardia salmonicida TaxID=53431 RepID=UPI0037A449C4
MPEQITATTSAPTGGPWLVWTLRGVLANAEGRERGGEFLRESGTFDELREKLARVFRNALPCDATLWTKWRERHSWGFVVTDYNGKVTDRFYLTAEESDTPPKKTRQPPLCCGEPMMRGTWPHKPDLPLLSCRECGECQPED